MAIIDLIADYAIALDSRDLDRYVNNFTPDGVFEGASGRREGREAIRAYVGGLLAQAGDRPRPWRHVLGIPQLSGDRDCCYAYTYLMIPQQFGDELLTVPRSGVYIDEVVPHEGRWRFRHRYVRMDLHDVRLV